MIYYFSATGNSRWVANEIAKGIQDKAVSIAELNKKGELPMEINAGETLGIVFPVYAWSTPKIVREFVKNIKVDKKAFVFAVCTCGDEAGHSLQMLKRYIQINSAYSIVMPNNYIIMFDIDSETVIKQKVEQAKKIIPEICNNVKSKVEEIHSFTGSLPSLKTYLIAPFFSLLLDDKKFYADSHCIGCGVCEQVCPLGNIKLVEKRPVWNHDCTQCTACINHCPSKAIQYGKATKKRGRYTFNTKG